MEIKARKLAQKAFLKEQLRELKPLKVRLAAATAERDKAIKLVTMLRGEVGVLAKLLPFRKEGLVTAEAEAKSKAAIVEALTAQQHEESMRMLGGDDSCRSPSPAKAGPAPTSPAQWAAGFAASLPQQVAEEFRQWLHHQPALPTPPTASVKAEQHALDSDAYGGGVAPVGGTGSGAEEE